MKIIQVLKDITVNNNIKLKAGHGYVIPEDMENQFRCIYKDALGISYPVDTIYKPYKGEDLTNKKLIVWRTGGIGDILFLSSALVYIKEKYPSCYLIVATANKDPLKNIPAINELHDIPFDIELLQKSDYHLMFQGIIESSSEQAKTTHATDLYFKYFSIDSSKLPNDVKRPKLYFTNDEMLWRDKTLSELQIKENDYVIGIQMETSSPLRNFSKDKLKAIIDTLAAEDDVKIVLIGIPASNTIAKFYKGNNPNVIIATSYTVRQSIILATRYDLIIAPDSFMIQVAGALEKPLIGLYGPFPSKLRMAYFKNAIAIEPKMVCTPCFEHDFRPCIKGYPSPCFSLVLVEDILMAIHYQKTKFTGTGFKYMEKVLDQSILDNEASEYMLSADKGISFFGAYIKHDNIISVDTNPFFKANITELNTPFRSESFPFVLYVGPFGFQSRNRHIYDNVKRLVRQGGYFIVYSTSVDSKFHSLIVSDIEKTFIVKKSVYDINKKIALIVGEKPYSR